MLDFSSPSLFLKLGCGSKSWENNNSSFSKTVKYGFILRDLQPIQLLDKVNLTSLNGRRLQNILILLQSTLS